jgi:hypothetical protein
MENTWMYGHMPLSQRAKIFTPFALKGFENLIREQENTYDEMPELSDDQYEDLNFAINNIRAGDSITIKYFKDYKIRTLSGSITKLSKEKRYISVNGNMLNFDELIEIDL